jgi:hypothetical protein
MTTGWPLRSKRSGRPVCFVEAGLLRVGGDAEYASSALPPTLK